MKPFRLLEQHHGSEKRAFARGLRHRMTEAEWVFWERVRGGVDGMRFRRQVLVRGYIADFYCHRLKLVVEIDGAVHRYRKAWDARRDAAMRGLGLCVVRLSNDEVLADMEAALRRALREAAPRSP